MEDFRDPETARRWSADPVSHNPVRREQLDILLSILEAEHRRGAAILDIGFGSGIVEEMIFERIPGAYVVGVDGSPAMLDIANNRLAAYKDRYTTVVHDITGIGALQLPPRDFQIAISVQTTHNVADEHKRQVFEFVYETIQPGGLFLLMDRIAIDVPGLYDLYKTVWKRQERMYGARARLDLHEGETFEEHRQTLVTRGDQPATLEQHLQWLRDLGFEVACIHLHANRALFAARKVKRDTCDT